MTASIHDAAAALADGGVNAELPVQHLADETIEVCSLHGRDGTPPSPPTPTRRAALRSAIQQRSLCDGHCRPRRRFAAINLYAPVVIAPTLGSDMPSSPSRSPEFAARALRLAAAGAVGASVVHELRNSLAVVSSSLYLARRDHEDTKRLLHHLDKASNEVIRAQAVVAAVLGLARGEALAGESALVSALVNAAKSAVVLPTNVTFSVNIAPSDLHVHGDPVLLERLLSNLYLNAIEALAGRGRGAISTTVRVVEGGIEFVVEDDGPGFDPALGVAIFDPLVTTKESGTGLGLALVRAVAEAHGGSVYAAPREGAHGARICVLLPA